MQVGCWTRTVDGAPAPANDGAIHSVGISSARVGTYPVGTSYEYCLSASFRALVLFLPQNGSCSVFDAIVPAPTAEGKLQFPSSHARLQPDLISSCGCQHNLLFSKNTSTGGGRLYRVAQFGTDTDSGHCTSTQGTWIPWNGSNGPGTEPPTHRSTLVRTSPPRLAAKHEPRGQLLVLRTG